MKVGFISLGCSKNRVDTEIMMAAVKNARHNLVFDINKAEIIIINTCAFIEDAQQEAVDTILETARLKERGELRYLIAAGCLVQRFGKALLDEMPELDGILGISDIYSLDEVLKNIENHPRFCNVAALPERFIDFGDRVLTTPPGSAYVKIVDGCDNNCSYCTIPSIRGRLRSRSIESIVSEVETLMSRQIKEIVLIGQDTAVYGLDLYGEAKLDELLTRINDVAGLEWVRLMYLHPAHLNERIIAAIARENKVIPYLDMPIQHAADTVLQRMNRYHNRSYLDSLIKKLRASLPGLCLRTTVMVGFPGETASEFKTLVDFIEETEFEWLGAFAFTPEEGTKAASMDDMITDELKTERLHEIMVLQKKITRNKNIARINTKQKVLISSSQDKDLYIGRTYFQAPEVDGLTLIRSPKTLKMGQFVETVIKATVRDYDLIGETITDELT